MYVIIIFVVIWGAIYYLMMRRPSHSRRRRKKIYTKVLNLMQKDMDVTRDIFYYLRLLGHDDRLKFYKELLNLRPSALENKWFPLNEQGWYLNQLLLKKAIKLCNEKSSMLISFSLEQ